MCSLISRKSIFAWVRRLCSYWDYSVYYWIYERIIMNHLHWRIENSIFLWIHNWTCSYNSSKFISFGNKTCVSYFFKWKPTSAIDQSDLIPRKNSFFTVSVKADNSKVLKLVDKALIREKELFSAWLNDKGYISH